MFQGPNPNSEKGTAPDPFLERRDTFLLKLASSVLTAGVANRISAAVNGGASQRHYSDGECEELPTTYEGTIFALENPTESPRMQKSKDLLNVCQLYGSKFSGEQKAELRNRYSMLLEKEKAASKPKTSVENGSHNSRIDLLDRKFFTPPVKKSSPGRFSFEEDGYHVSAPGGSYAFIMFDAEIRGAPFSGVFDLQKTSPQGGATLVEFVPLDRDDIPTVSGGKMTEIGSEGKVEIPRGTRKLRINIKVSAGMQGLDRNGMATGIVKSLGIRKVVGGGQLAKVEDTETKK